MPFTLLKETLISTVICVLYATVGSLILSTVTWANVRILAVPEKTGLTDAGQLSIKLYITNDTGPIVTYTPPSTIKATLKRLDRPETFAVRVSLQLAGDEIQKQPFELAEGQFRTLSYRFTLPEDLKGLPSQELALTLDLPDGDSYTALVITPPDQGKKSSPLNEPNKTNTALNAENSEKKPESTASFLANFSGYEPIYFLYGATPSNAKFQLSFKYRFINPLGNLARNWPWFSRLHLGYTQTAFWDLTSESRPFTDTIFQPALFYQYQLKDPDFIPSASHFEVLAGVQHQSNGKDGSDSRSLNIGYVEPSATFSISQNLELNLRARAWVYLGDKSDNPDIQDFRGNGLISVGLGNPEGLMLVSELRGNPGTGKGSIQFDLSYPLNHISRNLDLYLFGQLYSGYGESLIDYNRKDTRLRFGIALQR